MKKSICLLLCFCTIGFAQLCNGQTTQNEIDSLLNMLKTAKEDTNKIYTLNSLSDKFVRMGIYDKAKTYASDALQLSEKINYKKGKAGAYNDFGTICLNQGNVAEALKNYLTSLKISEEIRDKDGIANGYLGMGNVYYIQGNIPESLKDCLAALKIMEEVGDKRGIARCYVGMRNVGSYDDALKYLLSALKIFKEIDDKHGMANCYINIGAHYEVLGNYSEALKNYLAALKVAEESGEKKYVAWSYGNISGIYLLKNNYSEALEFNFKALKIQEETGDRPGIVSSYNNLGVIYTASRNFTEANKYMYAALSLSKETNSSLKRKGIYRDIILLDSAKGDYKQALADYRIYERYKDSLENETAGKQRAEMRAKFEAEKNEKEIALLTKDNEIKNIEIKKQRQLKYFFIGGLMLLALVMVFGYRVYRSRQILRLQDIRNKIAGDLHDDIGSTLNSISIYSEVARKNDAHRDEALEMIGEISRKIIDVMSDIVWTINPENDSFAKVIFRMKSLAHNLLRAKNIEYTFHVDEGLDERKLSLEDRRNFYLLFKEAINNLVKYSAATRVIIRLSNEGNRMKLLIRDNGIGFDMTAENAGNGLKNMQRRADEMKAKFKIESQKGSGTQMELILAA